MSLTWHRWKFWPINMYWYIFLTFFVLPSLLFFIIFGSFSLHRFHKQAQSAPPIAIFNSKINEHHELLLNFPHRMWKHLGVKFYIWSLMDNNEIFLTLLKVRLTFHTSFLCRTKNEIFLTILELRIAFHSSWLCLKMFSLVY